MKILKIAFAIVAFGSITFSQQSLVNFAHLEHLTEGIYFNGDSVNFVHIYADYPSYKWIDANDEGIACVDDAARASVACLRHYELTKTHSSLKKAKELLKFIIKMQASDGHFYNFIFADHTINRNGKTSYKSFGWWAARGMWCMGLGFRVFEKTDPAFASELQKGIEETFYSLDTLLLKYGKTRTMSGLTIPQWLLYESGSDATTELVLGLNQFYTATSDKKVKTYIEKLCNGMMMMQNGDIKTYPYGLHRSWETMWHAWGNSQTQALAEAGKLLNNKKMIQSAKLEADGFYSRLLIQGFKREFDVADSLNKREFEQIAYDIRPMTVGLLRLFDVTNDSTYLVMAKIAASWFFGNNVGSIQMYDPKTGRCFDGIHSATDYSKNSGAESTIEALNVMIELQPYLTDAKYFPVQQNKKFESKKYLYGSFSNGDDTIGLLIDKEQEKVSVLKGKNLFEFEKSLQ